MNMGIKSMRKYLIFGTNGMAKDLCNFIESDGHKMAAYILDEKYIKENTFYGKEVIPYEKLAKRYSKDEITILVMIGYSKMNEIRRMILERCRLDGWNISSFIHSSVLNRAKCIGNGNIIFPQVDLGSDAVIGDGNVISLRSVIGHDSVMGNYNYFAGSSHVCGAVKIGDHNFFGENCTIIDNLRMGNYNLIGAGVCLNKNIQNNTVAVVNEIHIQSMNLKGMDLLLRRVLEKK